MWSIEYKGHYIQGTFDVSTCNVVFADEYGLGIGYKECSSLHAAKLAITKYKKDN